MLRLLNFIFLLFPALVVNAYMMGEDNREIVDINKLTPAAIRQTGQIQISGEAFVTGIVMGANCDVVLSAGHAAFYWQTVELKNWLRGTLRSKGRFKFSLKPQDKTSFIKMTLLHSGYEDIANLEHDRHDWSLFRLQRPALDKCEDFSIITTASTCQHSVIMPAFHFDKPDNLLIDNSCQLKGTPQQGIIVHDCDTKEGSSGAPLFCKQDNQLSLLGLNISGLTQKEYQDPGVYGLEGKDFHPKWHKNHAVSIQAEFYQALIEELAQSGDRFKLKKEQQAGEEF